jgi:hypothetical protein
MYNVVKHTLQFSTIGYVSVRGWVGFYVPTWDVQHGMSNMGCPTWDVQHGMSNMGCPTWDVQHGMSNMGCPTWDLFIISM